MNPTWSCVHHSTPATGKVFNISLIHRCLSFHDLFIIKIPTIVRLSGFFVRLKGLEPTHLSVPDPKSGAATNYATAACCNAGAKIHSFLVFTTFESDF